MEGGANSETKKIAFVRIRRSKQDVHVQQHFEYTQAWSSFVLVCVPKGTEQSVIVRNSLIVMQEQSRFPVQLFLKARVSAAQVLMCP